MKCKRRCAGESSRSPVSEGEYLAFIFFVLGRQGERTFFTNCQEDTKRYHISQGLSENSYNACGVISSLSLLPDVLNSIRYTQRTKAPTLTGKKLARAK